MGTGRLDYKFDLGLRRSDLFLQKGWTEKSRMKVICPSGKSLRAPEFRIASIVPRIEA
jgi:hypothetical protein